MRKLLLKITFGLGVVYALVPFAGCFEREDRYSENQIASENQIEAKKVPKLVIAGMKRLEVDEFFGKAGEKLEERGSSRAKLG